MKSCSLTLFQRTVRGILGVIFACYFAFNGNIVLAVLLASCALSDV